MDFGGDGEAEAAAAFLGDVGGTAYLIVAAGVLLPVGVRDVLDSVSLDEASDVESGCAGS